MDYHKMVCPRCGVKNSPLEFFEHTHHHNADGSGPPASRVVPLTALSVTVALALVWYLAGTGPVLRRKRIPGKRCACPKCGRRLAYDAAKEGQKAICPGCKQVFVLQPNKPKA